MVLKTLILAAGISTLLPAQERTVYVGTYTGGASKGIYAFRFNAATGKTTEPRLAADSSNPTFLALHPSRRFLYAANENSNGTVSAFAVDASGALTLLNSVSSRGSGPCHMAVDRTGKWAFTANYNSGSVAVFPLGPDGRLGEASTFVQLSGSSVNRDRQAGSHAHEVVVSADNRFVLVADLGTDRIVVYEFDAAKGTLTAGTPAFVKSAPGAGPRHLTFSSDGRYVYVLNEIAVSVTVFSFENGRLSELQTLSTLPADFAGSKSGAEIVVHPNGKFLYASNRGHDSIALFQIDSSKGTLTSAGYVSTLGKTPRNFAIDPTGAYLLAANQDSGTIVVFRIDPRTGSLTPSGNVVQIPAPVSLVFTELP
jgi:6-phosphogluconolactonase